MPDLISNLSTLTCRRGQVEDGSQDGGRGHPGVHPVLPEPGALDELHLQGHRLQQIRNLVPRQISGSGKSCFQHQGSARYL
jgi:hypothetical protein